jgi:amino acid adenylation domain-containing protein
MNDVNELKKKALAGDLSALEELRQRGVLSDKKLKYSMAPLSYAQRRLWFIDKMDHSPAYNLPAAIILEGNLNIEALERSFREIIRRHEILRTCFVENDGVPFQKIFTQLDFRLTVTDLCNDKEQHEKMQVFIQNEIHRCFDLSVAPLLTCQLLKLHNEKHLLIFKMHHIISDGWSIGVLISELNQFYSLFSKGLSCSLPPLKFQYKDYVHKHEQLLQSKEAEKHRKYWIEKFSGDTEATELPADLKRPLLKTYNGRLHEVVISDQLYCGISELIGRGGVSLFMFLISVVNTLLNKYTGKTGFILGSPVSGREFKDTEDQIGFYVNTISLRNDINVSKSFRSFLEQVKQECIGAYEHQLYPFDLLVEDLKLKRDISRNPLFEIMVSLEESDNDLISFEGIKSTFIRPDITFSKMDLHFNYKESAEGLKLDLVYNPDLYSNQRIERLGRHFLQLLKKIIIDPDERIGKIEMISDEEKQQILKEFNSTGHAHSSDKTIASLFDEIAERYPDKSAVVYQGRPFSYSLLKEKADALAVVLQNLGLKEEEPVAILMERSHELVICILAILKAGGAYLPLDYKYPDDRIHSILKDAGTKILLTDGTRDSCESVAHCVTINEELFSKALEIQHYKTLKTTSGMAYILYTSGSTGKPKGSMIEERSVIRLVKNTNYTTFTDADKIFSTSSISFDATTWDIWGALLNGGTLYLENPEDYLDPERLKDYFSAYGITKILIPTGLFCRMLEADQQQRLRLFEGLEEVLVGGDRFPSQLSNLFIINYPEVDLINVYGPTENTCLTTTYKIKSCFDGDIPIGKPISNTTVYILNGQDNLCPVGVPGELCTAGEGVSRGYMNRPDLDQKSFMDNPFVPDEKMYRTGDWAQWDEEGNLHFLGRGDDQLKIRGFRVETGEIENTAMRLEGISQAKVIVMQEEDQKHLALYFTSETLENQEALKEYLSRSLPEYMIPDYFIQLKEFPLNQNGKIDTKALPTPKDRSLDLNQETGPSTITEKVLVKIYKEILNHKFVPVNASFFSLGGHSLAAIRVVSAIQKELSVKLSLKEFFMSPDIVSLGRIVQAKKKEVLGNIPVVPKAEYYELSHAQKRLWVLDKIETSKSTYNIPLAIRITDGLDINSLQYAFDDIVQRHEALRTVFIEVNGTPFQKVIDVRSIPIEVQDFSGKEDPETAAFDFLVHEAQRPFKLYEFSLVRLSIIHTIPGNYFLFLNIHHIVCDGWSVNVLVDELFCGYRKHLKQEPDIRPDLVIQYKDYASWFNKRVADSASQEDRQYWLLKLGGEITPLDLPTDFSRPPVKTYEGESLWFTYPQELKERLDAFNVEKRTSLFMTLTAALKVLLYRYTAKEDIIIGTPVAGRDHPDLEEQIGCYVNTLALRDRMNPQKSFIELLQDIKETATEAYSHQMYPFNKLVEDLKLSRDSSRSPLFDVMIVFQNSNFSDHKTFSHIEPVRIPMNLSKFDLTFNFNDSIETLDLLIEYNTNLFRRSRIEQMASHLEILLNEIIANPVQSLCTVNILSSEDKNNLLKTYNNTGATYPYDKTIIGLFEEAAAKHPSNIAVVYDENTLTYAELNALAERIADNILLQFQVECGEPIGVLISPSENMIAVLLAILKTGGSYVPVDPEYPDERIRHIISESRMKGFITQKTNEARLRSICEQEFPGCNILILEQIIRTAGTDIKSFFRPVKPDTTAYVIFTSGSTGKPKGCPVSHRNLVRLFVNDRNLFDFGPSDVWVMAHSYCFDFSVWEMYGALLFGGKLIIADRIHVRNIAAFVSMVNQHRVTVLNQTPGAFYKFIDAAFELHEKNLNLRYIIFGGDKLDPSKLGKWIKIYPADHVSLINMYGITETTIHVTYHRLTDEEIYNNDGSSNIGKPLPETRVYILDEALQLVPAGVYGEIYVAGTGLSSGYLNRPDLTRERFISNPFEEGRLMYRSGDIGRWLFDGTIEYLDRIDSQVQIRGFRVETAEIELQLRRHPAISETVVVAIEKEGTKELAAYLVLKEEIIIEDVKRFLSALLPDYMIPSFFIQIEKIPLTVNGKLDKKSLPPAIQNISTGAIFQTPETDIEAVLLELWHEVLSVENISIFDNFFDIGGNSILLVKLHGKINERFPGALEITDLFTKSRISEQAAGISHNTKTETNRFSEKSDLSKSKWHDMAIVGVAARIGWCETPEDFWKELCNGTDFIKNIPENRLSDIQNLAALHNIDVKRYREYCYLPEVDLFDNTFFKLSPTEASLIDPGQRLFLETACHAMEDAGYGGSKLWGSRTGVFIGASGNLDEYAKYLEASEDADPNLLLAAQTPSILASRLSYHFNLKGPAMLVDTACSSSLVALHMACQCIRDGKIDAAIVGGTKLHLLPFDSGSRMEIDSADSRAHSFDDSANGTGGGEGVIAIMIKPLETAFKDHDYIYAVIKGSAINQDGNSNGITAPDAEAQADVIDSAWQDAGIDPRTVSFIETHGTGTKLGDPIEVDGINKAFRRYTSEKSICALGAVKANIGHLDTVAGMAGVLKAVFCLRNKKLPPLAHYKTPNRNINFEDSAAFINRDLTPWEKNGTPLRCGVSSFGLSGTNCHVIMEEAPATKSSVLSSGRPHLFVLSSRSQEGLLEYIVRIQKHLFLNPDISPESLCYTLATGRGHYSCRLAILFKNGRELHEKLSEVIESQSVQASDSIFFQYTKIVSSSKKELSANEITEKDIQIVSREMNALISQGTHDLAKSVAEGYVKGANINWEDYYGSSVPSKVSLPGYPFEKKRCWVQLKMKNPPKELLSGHYCKNYEAVFLNHCILDTPAVAIYRCIFNNETWLLNEHRVDGQSTLVGVSYLQVAWEAGKNHLHNETLQLTDFFLLQPLTTFDGQDLEVLIVINKAEEILDVRMHSNLNEDQWIEYARFKVSKANIQPEQMDINAIQGTMPLYREYNSDETLRTGSIVQVSQKWNTLHKVWGNETGQLAELIVPHEDETLASCFQFYPPLADAALSFVVDESGFLPWTFGTVELRKKAGNKVFSYVTKQRNISDIRTYDVTLTNETGQIVATFKDFTLKKALRQNNLYHELVWKSWPLRKQAEGMADNPVVLFNRHCPSDLINEIKAANTTMLEVIQDQYAILFGNGLPKKLIFILPDLQHENELEDQLDVSLYSLFRLAKYLSSKSTPGTDLLFIGRNVQEVNGYESYLNSLLNAAAGLGQVIGQENPNIRCRFLDVDEYTSISEILDEARAGFDDSYYYRTIRKGERFIREIKPVYINGHKTEKLKDGLYVITGGTGGLGLEIAEFLADNASVKIALLNRSSFPPRERWDQILKERKEEKLCCKIEKIRTIENKGGDIFFFSADVGDYNNLKVVFENIRRLGVIRGVIHAAGLPGDGLLLKKDLAVFQQVLQPKIQGTMNLYRLLQHERPDFFLMTSALTAILPTAGQGDYTAANSFMDAVCFNFKRGGLNAISINMTALKETGMAFEYGVADEGVFKSIAPKDAIEAIGKVLKSGKTSVILGETDLNHLDASSDLPFYMDHMNGVPPVKNQAATRTEENIILSGRINGQYTDCEKAIAAAWGRVLGYTELNINDNYYDLGGDSIHAIKISSLLEKQKLQVSIGDLFNYLTIAELAAYLETKTAKKPNAETVPILPAEKRDWYPVSAAQRRLFILDQLAADKLSYHIPEVWEIRGKLKIQSFKKAFNQLIGRHEILRTSFNMVEDIPVQIIHDQINFNIPVFKLNEEKARNHIRSFIQPFDFGTAPLFRTQIIKISMDRHLVLFDAHHSIIDAFSMELLKKELLDFYEGKHPEPLKIQYKDYAIWQNSLLRKEEIAKQKAWWLEQFHEEVPAINLPLDYPRRSGQSAEAGIISFAFDETLTTRIKRMSADAGFSTFMTLFAVYQMVMYKYTHQEDIIIGVTTMGRNREELSGLLGMFVNNLPIRAFPNENKMVNDFLDEVKTILSEAFANQDYPFDELVENLKLKRDLNRSPLFDIAFSYMNFTMSEIKTDEMQLSDYKSEKVLSSEYDIMLYGLEAQEKIYFTVKYKKSLFKKESIRRFTRHFIKAAEFIVGNCKSRMGDLDLLLPEEAELFKSMNEQNTEVCNATSVFDLLNIPLVMHPEKLAIIHTDRSIAYSELHARSNQLANLLRKNYAVKFGDRVGMMLNRDESMVIAMLGILKSGAAYVGIDPDYPQQRIDYILEDSHAKVLITSHVINQQKILPVHIVDINDPLLQEQSAFDPNEINTPGDPAYIIYTSGSTGQPKGVVITHKNLSVLLQWCNLEFRKTPFELIYATASYCFDYSVFEIFYPLTAGKTIRVLKSSLEILDWLGNDEKVLINTVPSLLNVIIDELIKNNFSHLSGLNIAGEQIPQALIEKIDCDRLEVRNLYGPSEDTTFTTSYRFSNKNKKVLIGKPISNTRIYIADSRLKLVPFGHPGEICIAGDGLAKGYLFKDELTNEKFINNPFGSGRLYRTGDLGRWTETGDLDYLGRIDRQVKIRGYRVELGEIETNIRQYPGIENAVVVAKENKEVRDIVAYLVAAPETDIDDLKAYLGNIMPAFMVPLYFIVLEKIPLTPNGKVDVKALPDPKLDSNSLPETAKEVLDSSEEILAAIWKEVLDVELLSKKDSFFDLGGHSLKALRLLAQINRTFEQQFVLADVFEHPSVAGFSLFMKKRESGSFQQLLPLPKAPYYEVSHAQRRMWTFNRVEKNSVVYNVPVIFLVKSALNVVALEKAFNGLIRKYESLRTYFIEVEGDPKQVILDEVDFKLVLTEIEVKTDIVVESHPAIDRFIKTPFNLEKAPLIKVALIKNQFNPEYLLIMNIHHIILDEWSVDILANQLAFFYKLFDETREASDEKICTPSPVQYKEFAQWQNKQITQAGIHREYWRNQFKEPPPVLDLPSDFTRPRVQTFEGKTERFILPSDLSDGLKKLSNSNQTTLFITSLALFHVLLSKYTRQDDLVIGTPVANRDHPDVQDQIGFFLNTLALRNRSVRSESFKSFLKKVRENTLASFSHQLYPFDLLINDLQLTRDLSRSPLFDVMLISQTSAGNKIEPGSELHLEIVDYDYPLSKFDLSISYYAEEECIKYFFEYNTSLFRPERIQYMFSHFVSLVKNVLADEETALEQLEIVSADEKNSVMKFSKGPEHELENSSIVSLIEKQVVYNADKTSVVFKRNKLSYGELNSKANQLAHMLISYNICPGDLVGVMVPRSEWSIIALLAILKAGAVYVPIDPSYPQHRIEYMLNDSRCKLVIVSGKQKLPDQNQIEIEGLYENLSKFGNDNLNIGISAISGANAYVIYTSGSTGKPKGILCTHLCLLNLIEWQSKCIEPNLKTLQFAPHSFDVSIQEILFTLATGGILYVIGNETRYNMNRISEMIAEESMNILTMPFSALNVFLSEVEDLDSLSSLKHLITSGEQPYLNDALLKLLKQHPSLQFHNQYGPSETHVVTSFILSSNDENIPAKIPAGRPIANTHAFILNKNMQLVPVGMPGDLYIGGFNVANGYLNRPDLTQKFFVDNPFSEGRLYISGDLARWNYNGELEFLGRDDQQVKVRGFRIELGEIELCLQEYPKVKEVVVKLTGSGENKEITAYYTKKGKIDSARLKNYLESKLPSYMIPAFFVKLASFPHTPSGKIDLLSLPEPNGGNINGNLLYTKPKGVTEKAIAEVWMEVLKQEKISTTDNFFEIGGNSIKAIKLMSKVQKQLRKKIYLNLIFEQPTIKQMARTIDETDEKLKHLANDFILLNPGQGREIFFLPPGIGYSFAYLEYAKYLISYTICGLNFIEADNPVTAMTDILTKIQKEGAFYLFGHSAGGNMAFDVALELQNRGRQVGGIILLDAYRQLEVIDWSEEEYLNDAILYIEQNHAEFLDEEIKEAALQKIIAYRRYLNARAESVSVKCPVIQIEANDQVTEFGLKISRSAWAELCPAYEAIQGFGGHMDMLKPPNLEQNAQLTNMMLNRLMNKEG